MTYDVIAQHAIPLAQTVRHFLAREIPYQQLEDLSWQLLSHWQDPAPGSRRQDSGLRAGGVFWHLHSLHQWDEQQIIADARLRLQLMECANYLTTDGPLPRHCIGLRP